MNTISEKYLDSMDFLFTKDQKWLDKWDNFLYSEARGNHLLYADWLQSYKSYGFDFEVFIIIQNDEIIGGFGTVIAKSLFFKFYIVPFGPIFSSQNEIFYDKTIIELQKRAKKLNCCYAQFSLPILNDKTISSQFYNPESLYKSDQKIKKGIFFKYVYSSNGLNWVNFDGCKSSLELLNKFSVQVRRNVNLSLRNDATFVFAKTETDCKLAYNIIEQNAIENNYSVRSFNDFKQTILSLIKKDKAFLMYVKVNNEIKGAAFVVYCGNYLTYITGGTKKEKPDLKIGYLLHWKIIEKSFELNYSGYNISLGGSAGVVDFKSKFNTNAIYFDEPHRNFIIKPFVFKVFNLVNSIFVKNKKTISNVLKMLKKF